MLEEQGSKRHGTVNIQDEVHSFGLAQRTRHALDDALGIVPVNTHEYDKHGNYVPEAHVVASSQRVPTSFSTYARKCRSELCRNCVRSPKTADKP